MENHGACWGWFLSCWVLCVSDVDCLCVVLNWDVWVGAWGSVFGNVVPFSDWNFGVGGLNILLIVPAVLVGGVCSTRYCCIFFYNWRTAVSGFLYLYYGSRTIFCRNCYFEN